MLTTGRDATTSDRGRQEPTIMPWYSERTGEENLQPQVATRSDARKEAASYTATPEAYVAPQTDKERESLYGDLQPLVRRLLRQYRQDPELRQDLEGEIYCRFCQ